MSDESVSELFREVNLRIAELAGSWEWHKEQGFLCECSRDDCTESVELTRAEYEAVREGAARFFILAGHERTDLERVVQQHDGYVVVEKLRGVEEQPRQDEQTA